MVKKWTNFENNKIFLKAFRDNNLEQIKHYHSLDWQWPYDADRGYSGLDWLVKGENSLDTLKYVIEELKYDNMNDIFSAIKLAYKHDMRIDNNQDLKYLLNKKINAGFDFRQRKELVLLFSYGMDILEYLDKEGFNFNYFDKQYNSGSVKFPSDRTTLPIYHFLSSDNHMDDNFKFFLSKTNERELKILFLTLIDFSAQPLSLCTQSKIDNIINKTAKYPATVKFLNKVCDFYISKNDEKISLNARVLKYKIVRPLEYKLLMEKTENSNVNPKKLKL